MLANKRGVCLPRLVLVPKRQPGVQMDLQSSDLPEEVQKLVKENSVKKVVFRAKTEYVPANYVVEMLHDNDNDITNDSRSYTRYEIFYCSEV